MKIIIKRISSNETTLKEKDHCFQIEWKFYVLFSDKQNEFMSSTYVSIKHTIF